MKLQVESRKSTSVQHNTFGLPCGVLVVDCPLPQAYNGFVIMALCERR